MSEIIERRLPPIDERLPLKQFFAEVNKIIDSWPFEIVENGSVYELFDVKLEPTRGGMIPGIAFYRRKPVQSE